jgi:hypothetical protein
MSAEISRLRARIVSLYIAAEVLMLIGIGVLSLYILQLGTLVGPGVEQSFGFAVALMFLMSAVVIHLVDRTYRVWPLGRRVTPTNPGPVTDLDWAHFLAVAVLVAAGGAIAYIIAGLVS